MALIICSECGHKVSDKATACPECGCPVSEMIHTKQNLYDVVVSELTTDKKTNSQILHIVLDICESDRSKVMTALRTQSAIKSKISMAEAEYIKHEIESVGGKVEIRPVKDDTLEKQYKSNNPTCPKCGSISITTSARGVDGFWGFLGASSTVNRCANCGHAWYPETGKSV